MRWCGRQSMGMFWERPLRHCTIGHRNCPDAVQVCTSSSRSQMRSELGARANASWRSPHSVNVCRPPRDHVVRRVTSPLPSHPSLDRIARVAEALGDLRDRVVFIGGAIAPLLQTHPPFPRARPTKDVDGVAATTSYRDIEALDQALRAREFRTPSGPSTAEHRGGRRQTQVHKWLAPGGIEFDLVPSGAHLGGSGSTWDQYALELSETVEIRPGLSIKHANAPAFWAMKWAAHHDRGKDDPVNSTDLEDILALIASRPTFIDELQQSPPELRQYVGDQTAGLLRNPDAGDLLAAHLNNATAPRAVIDRVRSVLDRIAHLG